MKVLIRPFDPIKDSGIIFSTMPKSICYTAFHPVPYKTDQEFHQHFYTYLKELIPLSKIFIATTSDDPNLILGYSIINQSMLEFVYIKEMFRHQGIATLLTKNKGIESINENNLTKIGYDILQRQQHDNLILKPKTLSGTTKKEESNDQRPIEETN